jgi:hypothetical protein
MSGHARHVNGKYPRTYPMVDAHDIGRCKSHSRKSAPPAGMAGDQMDDAIASLLTEMTRPGSIGHSPHGRPC